MRLIGNEEARERQDPYKTGKQNYHHIHARYFFPNVLSGTMEVYGGINNLTDKAPQKYLTGNGAGSGMYDVLGRTYYIGARYAL